MSDRHGWNSWDSYQAIHDNCLRDYDHFIIEYGLTPVPTDNLAYWAGVLYSSGGIEIHITKYQESEFRNGQRFARTVQYSYHVLRRQASHTINLFRYDNIHVQPGHATAHHYHRFDDGGNEIEPPTHMGEAGWPLLSDAIEEAYNGWLEQSGDD